jgi:excisionase family DNA binding protein
MIGSAGRGRDAGPLRSYSPREVCGILGCKIWTFYQLVKDGRLKSFRVGRSDHVLERDLLEFIESRRRVA